MNIVLTGFMASGKSAISKALKNKLTGYTLVDTDELIVDRMSMTINEIFEKYGENEFRRIEHEIICEVSKLNNTIISTGGGVVLNKDNVRELRKNGVIVNLSPDFETIKERLDNARSTRPLLKNSDIDEIYERFVSRLPYYDDCDIKIQVSNNHNPQYFAKNIIDNLELIQKWMSSIWILYME